jgi:hypothetical protein
MIHVSPYLILEPNTYLFQTFPTQHHGAHKHLPLDFLKL